MKVKIKKTSFQSYWYEDCIGEIFEVKTTIYMPFKYEIIVGRYKGNFIDGEDCELIEDFILPDSWYCVVTKENIDVLGKWRFGECSNPTFPCGFKEGCIVGIATSNKNKGWDKSYKAISYINSEYVNEITFEQFKKYVLKENTMENKTIVGYKLTKPEKQL